MGRRRGREDENGKIVLRSTACTHDGKLPPILDKLSTILEECRREVTPRRAFVSGKTDNLPGIKGELRAGITSSRYRSKPRGSSGPEEKRTRYESEASTN